MDYGVIIPIAAYLVAVQLATRTNTKPLVASLIATIVPYIVSSAVRYILDARTGTPSLLSLLSITSLVAVLLQFAIGLFIFKKLSEEEDILGMVGWAVGGFLFIVVIPYCVTLIR